MNREDTLLIRELSERVSKLEAGPSSPWSEPTPKRKGKSYADIASTPPTSTENPFGTLGKRPVDRRSARIVSGEELARVLLGVPRKPGKISAVYTASIKAMPVSNLKKILKQQCGVQGRNILNIDFIGKSLTEFHVFSDYEEEFKKILQDKIPNMTFIEMDPLCPDSFKDEAILDRVTLAATKYAQRLEKRVTSSPSMAHRTFLRAELARASLQGSTKVFVGKGGSDAMPLKGGNEEMEVDPEPRNTEDAMQDDTVEPPTPNQ